MKTSLVPRSLLLVPISLLLLGVVRASTVVIPSDEEMIIGARAIVRGTVISSVSGYDEKHRAIFTYTTLQVDQVLKGAIVASTIVIKEPGGIAGGRGAKLFGIPQFTSGEEVLLYLDSWPDGSLRVYHWFLGKFLISRHPATGRPQLAREEAERGVSVLGRSRQGESTDRADLAVYLERLSSRVIELAGQSAAHEEKYYDGRAPRALPEEIGRIERSRITPQFTLINPYQPQRWFEADEGRPVVFKLNPTGMPNERIRQDILEAMRIWSSVAGSSIRLADGGATPTCGLMSMDGENTISFNNCDQYSPFSPPAGTSCAGVLAAAGIVDFDTTQRKMLNGINFYRALEGNVSFNPHAACYFSDSCNVREIAAHEFGHALGLGHSLDSDASMSPYAHFDGRCGSLRADDEAGIRFLYPPGAIVPTPVVVTSSLPPAETDLFYEYLLAASGGVPPYRWRVVSGSLPTGITMGADGLLRGIPQQTGNFTMTVEVTDSTGQGAQREIVLTVKAKPIVVADPKPVAGSGWQFYPLASPVRWLDTRFPDGACHSPRAPINGGSSLKQAVRGKCLQANIPATAGAVAGQITIINLSRGNGYYQITPGGAPRPSSGMVNFGPYQTLTTTFTVGLDNDGAFEIHTSNQAHLIVEIVGYYAPPGPGGLYFHPLPNSFRFLETRAGMPACVSSNQPLGIGATRIEKAALNCFGLTIPANARAVVGNAMATNLSYSPGFITFYASFNPRPNTANLNFAAAQTVSNQAIIGLSPGGILSIYSSTRAHLTLDLMGYFSPDESDANGKGLLFYPVPGPMRIFETRPGEHGCFELNRPLNAGQEQNITARLSCQGVSIPAAAEAVAGYATAINQNSAIGTLTLYPTGQNRPPTTIVNYLIPDVAPNSFTVKLGTNGAFSAAASGAVHLFIDLTGYFAP